MFDIRLLTMTKSTFSILKLDLKTPRFCFSNRVGTQYLLFLLSAVPSIYCLNFIVNAIVLYSPLRQYTAWHNWFLFYVDTVVFAFLLAVVE